MSKIEVGNQNHLSETSRRFRSNKRNILPILIFLTLLAFPFQYFAQPEEDGETTKGKTFVSIPVSVSDREGRYIPGLDKGDFSIYQDGVKQKISFFAKYDEPLNIALLMDTSGSTSQSLEEIKEGAKDFIDLLNENDRCQIVTFDSKINVLSPFTSDKKSLKKSLTNAQTANGEGTLLRGSIQQVAQSSFNTAEMGEGRKVIVVLSDGKDIGSKVTRDALVGYLEESDILIYTIFYKSGSGFQKLVVDPDGNVVEGKKPKKEKKPKAPKKPKGYVVYIPAPVAVPTNEEIKRRELDADVEGVSVLRDLSDTTAGRFYLSENIDLGDTFKKVAGELRQQYRLGYYIKNASGENKAYDIVVKVERPDAAVRTRGKFRAKQL